MRMVIILVAMNQINHVVKGRIEKFWSFCTSVMRLRLLKLHPIKASCITIKHSESTHTIRKRKVAVNAPYNCM